MVEIETDADRFRKILKFLVVGDRFTGKTSLIRRYVQNCFTEHYRSTIGIDFAHKDFELDDTTSVSVQLWDVSGQERFSDLTRMYYGGSVGAFVVFDVTKPETLDATAIWKQDIDKKVVGAGEEPIPVLLIGNKVDLVPGGWAKDMQQMEEFKLRHRFVGYIETSAKTAVNVNEAVRALVDYVLESAAHAAMSAPTGVRIANRSSPRRAECC
jgi:small GTP-binding protein